MNFNEHYGRLIYFGSGAEYSKKLYKPLMEEDYSKNSFPESGYELSKYLCGREIENCQFNNVFNLRLFGVYGKYERYDLRPVSNNILRALSGLPIKIYQDIVQHFFRIFVNSHGFLYRILQGLLYEILY